MNQLSEDSVELAGKILMDWLPRRISPLELVRLCGSQYSLAQVIEDYISEQELKGATMTQEQQEVEAYRNRVARGVRLRNGKWHDLKNTDPAKDEEIDQREQQAWDADMERIWRPK